MLVKIPDARPEHTVQCEYTDAETPQHGVPALDALMDDQTGLFYCSEHQGKKR